MDASGLLYFATTAERLGRISICRDALVRYAALTSDGAECGRPRPSNGGSVGSPWRAGRRRDVVPAAAELAPTNPVTLTRLAEVEEPAWTRRCRDDGHRPGSRRLPQGIRRSSLCSGAFGRNKSGSSRNPWILNSASRAPPLSASLKALAVNPQTRERLANPWRVRPRSCAARPRCPPARASAARTYRASKFRRASPSVARCGTVPSVVNVGGRLPGPTLPSPRRGDSQRRHDVLQFADVAGPVVTCQRRACRASQRRSAARLATRFPPEVVGEDGIVDALPERSASRCESRRGGRTGPAGSAAATSAGHGRFVAAMTRTSTLRLSISPTRRTSPSCNTRSSFACAARGSSPTSSSSNVPRCAYTKSPGRSARAPVNAPRHGRTARFDQVVWQRRAVERAERPIPARRWPVNRARDEFLAGAGFALHQDRKRRRRRPGDRGAQFGHRLGHSHQVQLGGRHRHAARQSSAARTLGAASVAAVDNIALMRPSSGRTSIGQRQAEAPIVTPAWRTGTAASSDRME